MQIADGLGLNRNLVSKYLSVLHMQGRVEAKICGTMKMYRLSNRIPYAVISRYFSGAVIGLDKLFYVKEVSGPLPEFGIADAKIIGKNCSEIHHPCFSDDSFYKILRSLIRTESISERLIFPFSNEWHQVQAISTIFDDRSTGIAVSFTDISEQIRNEQQCKIWKERYEALCNNNPRFIIHLSPDGKIRKVNPAYAAFFRTPPENIVGSDMSAGMTDDETRQFYIILDQVTPDHPAGTFEQNLNIVERADNWIQWYVIGQFSDGILSEYVLSGSDISDVRAKEKMIDRYENGMENILHEKVGELNEMRSLLSLEHKRRIIAEKESQQREARFISLVESLNDFVCEITTDYLFAYVNPYFLILSEYTGEEIIGSEFVGIPTLPLRRNKCVLSDV